MSGVMGSGGPPPKRSSQRRRANDPAAGEPTIGEAAEHVEVPSADPEWHAVVVSWFESLAKSGQSAFYEPSDWATALVLAESMSRELKPQPVVDKDGNVTMVSMPPKAAAVAAFLKGCTVLMATEGDRRRLALELERPKPDVGEAGNVSRIEDARLRIAGGPN